jgi:hypothetical protein
MTSEGLEQVGVVTRPESVVWYERLAWAAFVVGLASAAANARQVLRSVSDQLSDYDRRRPRGAATMDLAGCP